MRPSSCTLSPSALSTSFMHPFVLAAVLLVLATWASYLVAVEGVTESEIHIGQCAALDGPAARLGLDMQAGMLAAFAEANAAGGVHGRQIRLTSVDDGYEPDRAINGTLQLIEGEGVFALSGYVGTPTAKAVFPIVTEMEVPLIGLFTGAGFLRSPVTPQIFNVRGSYDDETEQIVHHLTEDLGITRIAVFYQNDAFGNVGLSGVTKALEKRGLTVAGQGTYERNTTAVNAGLASIIAAQPEAVVMVGAYAPLAAFVTEARAGGLDAIFSTISFTGTEAFIGAAGAAAEGVVISQVVPSPTATDMPVVAAAAAALAGQGHEAMTFGQLEGYVTARVLLAGLEAMGPQASRAGLISALEGIAGHDLGGLTIGYSADDHQAIDTVYMTQVSGAVAEPVTAIVRP